jgi:hypothetical protein
MLTSYHLHHTSQHCHIVPLVRTFGTLVFFDSSYTRRTCLSFRHAPDPVIADR